MWEAHRTVLENATQTGQTDHQSTMRSTQQMVSLTEALQDAVEMYRVL